MWNVTLLWKFLYVNKQSYGNIHHALSTTSILGGLNDESLIMINEC